jgi:hypothetical protein
MNGELERIWKEAVVAYPGISLETLRKPQKPSHRTTGVPARDSNLTLPKYSPDRYSLTNLFGATISLISTVDYVGFEVLTAVVIMSTIFWDITLLSANRRFGGKFSSAFTLVCCLTYFFEVG